MNAPDSRQGWPKPLDVGNGEVCASFAVDGSLLSLGRTHPGRGFVELTAAPAFDEAWRGEPDAVRRYRRGLTQGDHAALQLTGPLPTLAPDPHPPGRPRWSGADTFATYQVEAWAPADQPVVVQRHVVRAGPDIRAHRLTMLFSGRLERPAFGEITEVSPLPPLTYQPSTTADGGDLRVADPSLPAVARVRVSVVGGTTTGWQADATGHRLTVSWDPRKDQFLEVTVAAGLLPTDREAAGPGAPPESARSMSSPGHSGRSTPTRHGEHPTPLHVPDRLRPDLSRLMDGNLNYILGCTALTTAPGERCILTDHRLLQLSWTRDAYFQALLLLAARHIDPRGSTVVAEHLRWLWDRCDRSRGGWMRSHLPNGAVKDHAFQADQQLYPVLELLDYADATGGLPSPPPDSPGWGPLITETWGTLPLDPELGLITGEENPADDPAELPYLLSSQILLWHTATRLHRWQHELAIGELGIGPQADTLRAAIRDRFGCPGPFGTQWAYESDGHGRHRRYHDANDVPTVLAPLWGFCTPNDPEWAATMRFAFDPANPGWSAGRRGGLGSAHTAGTWPLGDVQEWVAASLLADTHRAERVLERLLSVAAPDGLLPETYDSDTGAWLARHWFAWPGALLGALALGALQSGTEIEAAREVRC